MTKAEQKKAERKKRYDFVDEAAKIVLDEALAAIPHSGRKTQIRLNATNCNRYFYIHRYCEDLKFLIYRSGDIDIILHECCHKDAEARIVHYEEAAKNPNIALERFRDDVRKMVSDFMNLDWHYVMDYLSHNEEEKEWHEFYEESRKCYLDQNE